MFYLNSQTGPSNTIYHQLTQKLHREGGKKCSRMKKTQSNLKSERNRSWKPLHHTRRNSSFLLLSEASANGTSRLRTITVTHYSYLSCPRLSFARVVMRATHLELATHEWGLRSWGPLSQNKRYNNGTQ